MTLAHILVTADMLALPPKMQAFELELGHSFHMLAGYGAGLVTQAPATRRPDFDRSNRASGG